MNAFPHTHTLPPLSSPTPFLTGLRGRSVKVLNGQFLGDCHKQHAIFSASRLSLPNRQAIL